MGSRVLRVPKNNKSSFFNILHDGNFMNELRIPGGFVKNFGRNVPQTFNLRDSIRRSWVVSVEKDGNAIFLRNGWETFANHHGLKIGEFLVFRFNGKSEFSVAIFGTNFCEKVLHLANKEQEEAKELAETSKRTDPRIIHELRSKTMNEKATGKMTSISRKEVQIESSDVLYSFTSIVTRSGVYSMTIPKWFLLKYSLANIASAVILNARGEQWPVKVIQRSDGVKYLSWFTYSRANEIRAGCTCRFDFLKGPNNVIRVNILGTSSQGTTSSEGTQHASKRKKPASGIGRLGACQKKQKLLVEAKELAKSSRTHYRSLHKFPSRTILEKSTGKMTGTSRNEIQIEASKILNTFTSTVTNTGERRMTIPKWFVVQNGLASIKRVLILNARGDRWPVKVHERLGGGNYLRWLTFSKANGIHAGCICRFDLLKGAENAIRVNILRTSSKGIKQVPKRKKPVSATGSLVASPKERKVLEEGTSKEEVQIGALKVLSSFNSTVTSSGKCRMVFFFLHALLSNI